MDIRVSDEQLSRAIRIMVDSILYKAEIHAVMGRILLLGITEELSKTSQHKIQPIIKVEAMPRERTESKR